MVPGIALRRRWGAVEYFYVIEVEMNWYDTHEAVTGRSVHEVDNYRADLNGYPGGSHSVLGNDCPAYVNIH